MDSNLRLKNTQAIFSKVVPAVEEVHNSLIRWHYYALLMEIEVEDNQEQPMNIREEAFRHVHEKEFEARIGLCKSIVSLQALLPEIPLMIL